IGGKPILWHIMKHYAHYGDGLADVNIDDLVSFHQKGAWQTCRPDGNTASVNLYIDERPPFAPKPVCN
ncbi:MAG: hypothetical protein Q8N95_09150, partial [Desulfobacterales bacterium]|nr:hypothetical protein [Desulfobacterales bacterium]